MQPNTYRLAQLGISALIFCFSVAVIGCAGHSLHVYKSQSSSNPWWLPLWPGHFTSYGHNALISSAVVTLLLSALHLVLTLVPRFNLVNHPTLSALLVLAAAGPGVLITLSTVAYAHVLNHQSPSIDTIQSWTCRFKDSNQIPRSDGVTDSTSNNEFGRLCDESRFALYTTLVTCILEGVLMVLAIIGWIATKRSNRRQAKQWQDVDHEMNGVAKPTGTVQVQSVQP